jgi:hypothetical protein
MLCTILLIIGGPDHSKFAFSGHGAARSGAPLIRDRRSTPRL